MVEKLSEDIYIATLIKLANYEMSYPAEKTAGKFFRVRGHKPFMDPLRKAVKPRVDSVSDNVIMPAVQGFFGSGTAEGPVFQGIKKVTDVTKKWPYFGWTGKWDNVINAADRLGKMNVPDNPVARKINDFGKTLGKYDGWLGFGSAVTPVVSSFLGHLIG